MGVIATRVSRDVDMLLASMNAVSVWMSSDEWERILPALRRGRDAVLDDAIGDKWDVDSAIASGVLATEISRLEALAAADGPGVTLTWTPDQFGLFVYGLETVRCNASIPPANSPTVDAIAAFIRTLRGSVAAA